MIGLTPGEEVAFVFPEDRDKDDSDPSKSVFYYRTLTSRERTKLQDTQGSYDTTTDKIGVNIGSVNWLACKAGLTRWERFSDSQGNEIPFEKEGKQLNILGVAIDPPSDATLDRLTDDQIERLGTAIRKGQRLTPDDVKN